MTASPEHSAIVKLPDYPTGIVTEPFTLDDLIFTPDPQGHGRIERVTRDDQYIGDVLHDDNRFWFARKFNAEGALSDWLPMRSAAEARAFMVSKTRTR